jgi:hypothetical protein
VALVLGLSNCSFNVTQTLGSMLDNAAANVAAKKMDRVAEIRADVQAMENCCKKTPFAHAVQKLEAAGGAGCSSRHTVEPAAADESAFEALDAQVLEKIASIRTLILEAAGRDALDGVEMITNRMLPVLASVDPSTGLLSNEERTFFSRSNAKAEVRAHRSRWAALGLTVLGGVIVTGILSGGWRTGCPPPAPSCVWNSRASELPRIGFCIQHRYPLHGAEECRERKMSANVSIEVAT